MIAEGVTPDQGGHEATGDAQQPHGEDIHPAQKEFFLSRDDALENAAGALVRLHTLEMHQHPSPKSAAVTGQRVDRDGCVDEPGQGKDYLDIVIAHFASQ